MYVGTYSLYQGPEARGYSQHRAGGHRTEEKLEPAGGRIEGRGGLSRVSSLHLVHLGVAFPDEPSQIPMSSHNGPQLTLGELAHITLVAEDVFDALL